MTPTLTRRGWILSTCAWLVLCLAQAPLLTVADTKHDLLADPAVQEAVAAATARLDGTGRINVRASGTEPLIRVMVEGEDRAIIDEVATSVVDTVARVAGAANA